MHKGQQGHPFTLTQEGSRRDAENILWHCPESKYRGMSIKCKIVKHMLN